MVDLELGWCVARRGGFDVARSYASSLMMLPPQYLDALLCLESNLPYSCLDLGDRVIKNAAQPSC